MVCQPTPERSSVSGAVWVGDLRARLKLGGDFKMVGDTGAENGVVWGRRGLTFWWAESLDLIILISIGDFLGGSVVKNLPANTGDTGDSSSIFGSGRSPGGEQGNPLQYFCLENPMDRGGWQAAVHRVTMSWLQLKQLSTHTHNTCILC